MGNTLVILCGGDSSRMGSDKALLPFKDKCLIEYVVDRFSPYFDNIYLSVKVRGCYTHLNMNVKEIPDIYRDAGPMGGILSSLTMIKGKKAFFMSIDTPFLDPKLALALIEESKEYDITTYKLTGEYLDVICAVYRKSCITALGKCLIEKKLTKSNFYSRCYTNLLPMEDIANVTNVPFEQLFYTLSDRNTYYLALMAILKGNFF